MLFIYLFILIYLSKSCKFNTKPFLVIFYIFRRKYILLINFCAVIRYKVTEESKFNYRIIKKE